jgi:hypothetical protein
MKKLSHSVTHFESNLTNTNMNPNRQVNPVLPKYFLDFYFFGDTAVEIAKYLKLEHLLRLRKVTPYLNYRIGTSSEILFAAVNKCDIREKEFYAPDDTKNKNGKLLPLCQWGKTQKSRYPRKSFCSIIKEKLRMSIQYRMAGHREIPVHTFRSNTSTYFLEFVCRDHLKIDDPKIVGWKKGVNCWCGVKSWHFRQNTNQYCEKRKNGRLHFPKLAGIQMVLGKPSHFSKETMRDIERYIEVYESEKRDADEFCHEPRDFKMKNIFQMISTLIENSANKPTFTNSNDETETPSDSEDVSSDDSDSSTKESDDDYGALRALRLANMARAKEARRTRITITVPKENQEQFYKKYGCYVPKMTLSGELYYQNIHTDARKKFVVIEGVKREIRPVKNRKTKEITMQPKDKKILYAVIDENGTVYPTSHYLSPINLVDVTKSSYYKEGISRNIEDFLKLFESDPLAIAGDVGKLANQCVFCMKRLTDPDSLEKGYGRLCQEKWGTNGEILWINSVNANIFNIPVPASIYQSMSQSISVADKSIYEKLGMSMPMPTAPNVPEQQVTNKRKRIELEFGTDDDEPFLKNAKKI